MLTYEHVLDHPSWCKCQFVLIANKALSRGLQIILEYVDPTSVIAALKTALNQTLGSQKLQKVFRALPVAKMMQNTK